MKVFEIAVWSAGNFARRTLVALVILGLGATVAWLLPGHGATFGGFKPTLALLTLLLITVWAFVVDRAEGVRSYRASFGDAKERVDSAELGLRKRLRSFWARRRRKR